MFLQTPIYYTAIGDSITVGVGARRRYGYAYQYRDLMHKRLSTPVVFHNLGKNGWTSQDLVQALNKNGRLTQYIRKSNIITCTIGGNDLIHASLKYFRTKDASLLERAYTNFHRNFIAIERTVKDIKTSAARPYLLRFADIYNPFPDFPLAVRWVKRFNQVIHKTADPYTRVAPVYSLFLGREKELLSKDSIHPNSKGHQLIAGAFNQLGYGRYQKRQP